MKKILSLILGVSFFIVSFSQAPAIINKGYKMNAGQYLDTRWGGFTGIRSRPYTSVSEANAAVPLAFRNQGDFRFIDDGSGLKIYWYLSATSNGNLVPLSILPNQIGNGGLFLRTDGVTPYWDTLSGGGVSNTASNGLRVVGSDFRLGNILNENSTINGQNNYRLHLDSLTTFRAIATQGSAQLSAYNGLVAVGGNTVEISSNNGDIDIRAKDVVSNVSVVSELGDINITAPGLYAGISSQSYTNSTTANVIVNTSNGRIVNTAIDSFVVNSPLSRYNIPTQGKVHFSFDGNSGDGATSHEFKVFSTSTFAPNGFLQVVDNNYNDESGDLFARVAARIGVLDNTTFYGYNFLDNGEIFHKTNTSLDVYNSNGLFMDGTNGSRVIRLPKGTFSQRPIGIQAAIRFNTDSSRIEYYTGSVWKGLSTTWDGGIGGGDSSIHKYNLTLTSNRTLNGNRMDLYLGSGVDSMGNLNLLSINTNHGFSINDGEGGTISTTGKNWGLTGLGHVQFSGVDSVTHLTGGTMRLNAIGSMSMNSNTNIKLRTSSADRLSINNSGDITFNGNVGNTNAFQFFGAMTRFATDSTKINTTTVSDTLLYKPAVISASGLIGKLSHWPSTGGGGSGWGLTGNAGTTAGTNFWGTTDNVDPVFKRNNTFSGRIGSSDTYLGVSAGALSHSGNSNTAIGASALAGITGASQNTAVGVASLLNLTSGSNNTSIGAYALRDNTTGGGNIAIGLQAGYYNTTLSNQIFINSINRTNFNGDTTASPVYIVQNSTVANQRTKINGWLQVVDGTQGSGKVFTSDANGVGSWQTPSGGGGGYVLDTTTNNTGLVTDYQRDTATAARLASIALKANDNAVMHLTGNEAATGYKTFSFIRLNSTSGTIDLLGGYGNNHFGFLTGLAPKVNLEGGNASYFAINNSALGVVATIDKSGAANFGGSSSLPVASAALQVTSTTKGFLPPVMTRTLANAIPSKATGLELYSTTDSCKLIWNGTKFMYIGKSGTYVPTYTSTANIASTVVTEISYEINGDMLTITGEVEFGVTATLTPTELRISLPSYVTNNFTATNFGGGVTYNDAANNIFTITPVSGTTLIAFKAASPNLTTSYKYPFTVSFRIP